MNSPLLALFSRSVREQARARATYATRTALVLLVGGSLGMNALMTRWAGAAGQQFFQYVVFINFFFVTVAGLSYFASAITEEKEEETLALLRMTNLSPLTI